MQTAPTNPAYGSPEWNAAFDAQRKALGYPGRQEMAAFNARWPVYGSPEWVAAQAEKAVAA